MSTPITNIRKVWITKYALTQGIVCMEVIDCSENVACGMVRSKDNQLAYFHGEGREYHNSYDEALRYANLMRKKKVDSLRKLITKLENRVF